MPFVPDEKPRGRFIPDAKPEKYSPTDGQSFLQNFAAGAGKSFFDTARGIGQGVAAIGERVAPDIYGPVADYMQGKVDDAAALDAPLNATGGGILGNIAGQTAQFALPTGKLVGGALGLGGRIARGAATGAAFANSQPVTSEQTRLGNTLLGAAGGAAGEGIAAGVGKLVSASRNITPEVAALAQKAQQLGIPLRAEQVSKSRPLASVSAALDAVPFSGRDASREAQRKAFLRAIAKTFGQDTDNLATGVKVGQAALGAKYDSVLKSYPVNADNQFLGDLSSAVQAARSEMNDQQFSVIMRQADEILKKVGANNSIDGEAAYNAKKVLDRIARSQDSTLGYHAAEVRDALMSALDRSLPQNVAKDFANTRKQYANLIAVRKLVRAGADGNVTPAALGRARTSGDLKDIADIGSQFLTEPFGNSGTQNRLVGLGMLGGLGAGAVFDPMTAMTAAASGATIGRGANAALGSQAVINNMLNGAPTAQRALPAVNSLLPLLLASGAISSQ